MSILPPATFVHAVGGDLQAQVEEHPNPDHIDHVWISMDAGQGPRVLVSVNTLSRRNRDAGFDARVRVGLVRGSWTHLPPRGFTAFPGLDYGRIEAETNVYFEHYERPTLETLLMESTRRAALLEVWGVPYRNKNKRGIHQIHSRRASCAVNEDLRGSDGALCFYFAQEQTSLLVMLKFCGQP